MSSNFFAKNRVASGSEGKRRSFAWREGKINRARYASRSFVEIPEAVKPR